MAKKLVFFHATKNKKFGGFEGQCLLYGSWIAAHYDDFDVYYVNYPHAEENEPYTGSKLKIENISTCDFSKFEGATFVVAPNHLGFLLVHTEMLNNFRVLVWFTHPANLEWLNGQFFKLDTDLSELCGALEAKHGACFMDSVNRISASKIGNTTMTGQIVPVSIPFFDSSAKPLAAMPILSTGRIRIGWLGRLDGDKINSVINLLNNIRYSHFSEGIDFHIIGDGDAKNRIKMQNYSPSVRFVFMSYLYGEERDDYLRDNVDLVVAMGVSALDCAKIGLPVVIPIVQPTYFNEDKFVYLYDIEGYSLGWTAEQLTVLGLKYHPIKTVIDAVFDADEPNESKALLAEKCLKVCYEQFDITHNAELLIDAVKETAFTKDDLVSLKLFKTQMKWFRRYGRLTGRNQYDSFIRFNHRPRVFQYKHGFDKYKYLVGEIKKTHTSRKKKKARRKADKKKTHDFLELHRRYDRTIELIRERSAEGKPIRVAFLVLFKGVFALRPLFESMLQDKRFSPVIVIIPNTSRAMPYELDNYRETHAAMAAAYPGLVRDGYNEADNSYEDLREQYDLICFANPYDSLVPLQFRSSFFETAEVLTLYSSYALCALKFWDQAIASDFYNRMWRVCLENEANHDYLRAHQRIGGINGITTGYLKMDALQGLRRSSHMRKRIMLCPHHTVPGVNRNLSVSNFLDYSAFFLQLPKLYPDIDFVFRPHPLLFDNLLAAGVWSQQQVDEYINEIDSIDNLVYDKSDNYMQSFVDSDAMIHDCGSFIAEYLYTEKPCCYMVKDENRLQSDLLPFGLSCIEQYYHASSCEDIVSFIDNVVVAGNDPMAEQRQSFAREHLKVNYPNATSNLMNYLVDTLIN